MIFLLAVSAILGISAFYFIQTFFVIIPYLIACYCYSSSKKVMISVLVTLCGFYSSTFVHSFFQQTTLTGSEPQLFLTLNEIPDINGSSFRTIAQTVDGEKISLSYPIKSEAEKRYLQQQFRLGLVCKMNGELQRPHVNRNENGFNYQRYLQYQGIHWQFKMDHMPLEACRISEQNLINKVKIIRLNGLRHLEESFPPEASSFAAALLFGESDWIEEDILDAYKALSLVHILAISGLHVGIITAGLYYLFIRFGCTIERAKIILIILLPVYCLVAGGAPSVIRASMMVIIFLSLSLGKIRISSVSLLGYIFLFLLFINPPYLFHVGFQLSFFITFALLMSHKILGEMKHPGSLWQSFLVTIICQLCSMPIILYYFHEFSLWGFLLNILYIPLYTIVLLPATFITFLLSVSSFPFANSAITLLENLFHVVNRFAVVLAELPYSSLAFGKPSFFFVCLLTMFITLFFYFWEKQDKKYMYICSSCLLIALFLFYHKVSLSPDGEVTFIDVGQGDSILIKQPFGKGVYLIDTGGVMNFDREEWEKRRTKFDPGANIVVPLLKSKGIRKIDILVLTHNDQDHIGGGEAILEAIHVEKILISEALKEGFEETLLWKKAVQKQIPIMYGKRGQGWQSGGDRFQIIHPNEFTVDANESSLVLFATINGVKWLFTGDVGERGEKEIIEKFPNLHVDILKVGHHGSKTSSSEALLEAVNARIAVISAGVNNRYGHPHQEVLDALQSNSMTVLRTDLHGDISYKYLFGSGTFSKVIP